MNLQSKFFSALVICLWAATITVAQQVSAPVPQPGTIIGTVQDVNGGVVPGATVVLRGSSPGYKRRTVSQDNGFFQFDSVKPGTLYHVTVSAQEFADWTSRNLILTPGQFFILTGIALRVSTVQVTVNAILPEEVAAAQVKAAETQRVFHVVPNFYVVYDHDAVPLTPKLKFQLAMRTLVDPVTIAGFGFNAAIYQMAGYPGYRLGTKGYAERLGATFAGGYTNILVGDALLSSLLHQDPRYFYQGTGTNKSRLLHALSTPFITRGDNGRREINWSNIGGDLASGAIANAYYPASDRGAWRVISSTLIGMGGRMALGVAQEFVLHKHTSRGPQ
jgi:Carboxypeptidase regulatory-like domain